MRLRLPWVEPLPALESDPANVLAARTLRSVLIGALLYAVPFFAIEIPFFAVRKLAGSLLFLVVLLAALVSLFFLRKGKLRIASWIFLSAASLFATILVIFTGGISSPGLVIYIPVIIVTAWLLGRVVAWLFTALYVLMTLAMALLENAGVHLPKYFPAPPLSTWLVTLFFVAIVTVPLCQVLRTLSEALTKIQRQFDDLRLQEHELRESEERFRNMADTAPVMIAVTGPDQLATFFNRGWLEFTGRTMDQELGDRWTSSVHPEDRQDVLANYASSFVARRKCHSEFRMCRSDGEDRSVLCHSVPRFLGDGTFAGYISTCIDVTDLKRWQQKALASDRMESLRVLAMGVAHDFNNLMGGILASAELALKGNTDPAALEEDLAGVKAAALRGAEIVGELMIYAGEGSAVFEPTEISGLIRQMLQLLKICISKKTALSMELSGDLPLVRAKPTQIRRLLMNLVLNASEAIGERAGAIRISTKLTAADSELSGIYSKTLPRGDYILLEISDTGSGIPTEQQTKIFEPFFTTKPGGHGLGLAVVEGIVRSHSGAINLVSVPDQGTTFQIFLPIFEKTNEIPSVVAPPAVEQFIPQAGVVMVVEDDAMLRRAASKGLRKKGFIVLDAADGTVALDMIRAQKDKIDVILLDVTLPGMSSREFLDEVQRIAANARVILTSAYSKEHIDATFAGLGQKYFIRKPFQLGDLDVLIRRVLHE